MATFLSPVKNAYLVVVRLGMYKVVAGGICKQPVSLGNNMMSCLGKNGSFDVGINPSRPFNVIANESSVVAMRSVLGRC